MLNVLVTWHVLFEKCRLIFAFHKLNDIYILIHIYVHKYININTYMYVY